MIARKHLGTARGRAAGGSRERLHTWITRAVFYRSDQTKTLQIVAESGDVRGSRLPTHGESDKPNVPITPVQLRTVKSGSPPSVPSSLRSLCSFAAIKDSSSATPASLQSQPARKIFHTRFETDPRVGG